MAKETKGYSDDRQPEIIALDNYLKDSKNRSVKETARILQEYINSDSSENSYYQRIIKLRSGEYKTITDQERQAIQRFLHVERDPHSYGMLFNDMGDISRKAAQLTRVVQGKRITNQDARNRIKEFKLLNTLSLQNIAENSSHN